MRIYFNPEIPAKFHCDYCLKSFDLPRWIYKWNPVEADGLTENYYTCSRTCDEVIRDEILGEIS